MIWHPAETAPKDGTIILVWFQGCNWPLVARYNDRWHQWEDCDGWEFDKFSCWSPITKPEGVE